MATPSGGVTVRGGLVVVEGSRSPRRACSAWPCTSSLLPELVCFELQCRGVTIRRGVAKVEDHVERFGCWGGGSSHGFSPNGSISSPPPNDVLEACFDDENSSDASEIESQVEILCNGCPMGSGVSSPSSVPVGDVTPKTREKPASLDTDVPSADVLDNGLLGAKPVAFPMEQNQRLVGSSSAVLDVVERYRRLVGCLLYLSFTRPDLSFAIHVLSQFLHEPRQDHWSAALRVSVSGWIVFLGQSPVSWKSKKKRLYLHAPT
ncbi:hypothetical protein LIER_08059 [Lithospermum erythrorhizon]|uniref:Uncharacterized protein n=1 Tax=Lithospermum erythrorhizon TaxID=34254 RepID=A0AAV3PCA5_LITER